MEKMNLRIEEFELPQIKRRRNTCKIVTNSVCMSDHKAAEQGAEHKRIPEDIDKTQLS